MDDFSTSARQLAKALVASDLGLVYGGGNVGLMGIIADEVMALGGKVIGVIPQSLMEKEVGHEGLSELHVVGDMHERKAMMLSLGDGFIALPGGFGTMEELFEALTWLQLGFHTKPCGVLNTAGYYDALLAFLDNSRDQGFVKGLHRDMLLQSESADSLLDKMQQFTIPATSKWIGFGE